MTHPTPPEKLWVVSHKLEGSTHTTEYIRGQGDLCNYDEALAYAEAVRKQVLDKAAYIAEHACLVEPDGGSPSTEAYEACRYAAEQIRKLKEGV